MTFRTRPLTTLRGLLAMACAVPFAARCSPSCPPTLPQQHSSMETELDGTESKPRAIRPPIRVAAGDELRLTLTQPNAPSAYVRIQFRNVSKDVGLWVRYRGIFDVPELREQGLWVEVTNLDGSAVDVPSCRIRPSLEQNEEREYLTLPAGGEMAFDIRLNCNAPVQPARLLATAHYWDRREDTIVAPDGAQRYSGHAKSDTIEVDYGR